MNIITQLRERLAVIDRQIVDLSGEKARTNQAITLLNGGQAFRRGRKPKASRKTWEEHGHIQQMVLNVVAESEQEFRAKDVERKLGVTTNRGTVASTLSNLCKAGLLLRVRRGVYRAPKSGPQLAREGA